LSCAYQVAIEVLQDFPTESAGCGSVNGCEPARLQLAPKRPSSKTNFAKPEHEGAGTGGDGEQSAIATV